MRSTRYTDESGSFEVELPEQWRVEPDGEGGALVLAEEGPGLLHLMPFEREPGDVADPAEELYAFLEEQEIELEEDEVEDIGLGLDGSLALCEYVAEEAEELVYWMVAVATAPGRLLFASYSCAADEHLRERDTVREILASLRLGTIE